MELLQAGKYYRLPLRVREEEAIVYLTKEVQPLQYYSCVLDKANKFYIQSG